MPAPSLTPAFDFAGHTFHIIDRTALWWPAERTLIVADLHFEKASWFAAGGQMLPPYDSLATLDRLDRMITGCAAERMICLGDNFHDDDAINRIDDAVAYHIRILASRCRIDWISGNHDPDTDARFGGTVTPELEVSGIMMRHILDRTDSRYELSGHFHPKMRLRMVGHYMSRACFVGDRGRIILPAFGAFTGGLDVVDPAIASCFPDGYRAWIATRERLLEFPFAVAETPPSGQLSLWHK